MIEIPNIQPNSNNYQNKKKKEEEDHRVRSVVGNNPAKKMKTSSLQKFAKAFVPEDAKSMKEYVIDEAPGLIQGLLRLMFQNLLDTYLPDKGLYSGPGRSARTGNTTFRYDAIRTTSSSGSAPIRQRNTYSVYEYENVIFPTMQEAKEALDELYECLSKYEKVRVFDLYEAASLATRSTDRDYGWVDLRGVDVYPCADGWYINLPRAIQLT